MVGNVCPICHGRVYFGKCNYEVKAKYYAKV